MALYHNIRHYREFKGYSQKYLAFRLGISQASYSKIENGYTRISDQKIEVICKILEMPREKVFGEEIELILPKNCSNHKFLDELTENRKLLLEVLLNQGNLELQLNALLAKVMEK